MNYIFLPCKSTQRLVYYLAAEEFVAACGIEGFFCWRTDPCVIFGRNQDMESEVNVPYCESNGIAMWRRKSGGGCVYSDEGNLMLSYVVRGTDVQSAFEDYLSKLASALRGLGIPAVSTSHNDVLVDGHKVSGNACFRTGDVCIVHGTLLYDVDFNRLERAITPSDEKLSSHGVKSVRQRVANLRELGLDCGIDALAAYLRECFSDSELTLGSEAENDIRSIEATYLDPDFIERKI